MIASLRRRLPANPLTRFAPSPTGYLHLGHVVHVVYVWGLARALGGRVLFRLEDHDRGRCRAEYASAIVEDLAWLGLAPDIGGAAEFQRPSSSFRQSDCDEAYAAALHRLARTSHVYACDCSRKTIAAEAGNVAHVEPRYSGRCRLRGLAIEAGRGVRARIDDGVEHFDDPFTGQHHQAPALQCGDLLVRDRLGQWTYQFAVTVDDLRHDIDLVIRGEDLLDSTGRQIRLGRMLGRGTPAVFVHHPLIRHPTGEKLSKANRDTAVRDLRAAGARPAAVLGRAAFLAGLLPAPKDLAPEEIARLFR